MTGRAHPIRDLLLPLGFLLLVGLPGAALAQLSPAMVTVNQLCEDIRKAEAGPLGGVKSDLKSWMRDDVDLANEIIHLEDLLGPFQYELADQAESVDRAQSELDRLVDEKVAREDTLMDNPIAQKVDKLNSDLKRLDKAQENLKWQRAVLDAAAYDFVAIDDEIAGIQQRIDRIDRGDYTRLAYPAEHERRALVMDLERAQKRREASAHEAGRAFNLNPGDWPRDQTTLQQLKDHGQQEWESYQAQRNRIISDIASFQKYLRERKSPEGRADRVAKAADSLGADRLNDEITKLRQQVQVAESAGKEIPKLRQRLSARQAAWSELWNCVKEREQELGIASPAPAGLATAPRWSLDGTWQMLCDDKFAKWDVRGGLELAIGESGETFGKFWEVDGAKGTVTGRVVAGQVDWTIHYRNEPIAVSGNVVLGAQGRASGQGNIVTGELSTVGRCAGNWAGQ